MSFSEIKGKIQHLDAAEQEELAACVVLARKARDPQWAERAARLSRAMDAGRAHSEGEVRELHQKLSDEGR